MITIHGLGFRNVAIDDLRICPGWNILIGANGSGKTTFIDCFTGFTDFTGDILVDGVPVQDCRVSWLPPFPDRGFVFATVADEVASPLRFAGVPCTEIRRRVTLLVEQTGISSLLGREMQTLSGGEKVIVSLVTALVSGPEILLIDEAFSSLDPVTRDMAEDVVRGCRPNYIIEATHDMDRALNKDRVIYLEKGGVPLTGNPREVFHALRGTPLEPLGLMVHGAGL